MLIKLIVITINSIIGFIIGYLLSSYIEERKQNKHNCFNCSNYYISDHSFNSANGIFYKCKKKSKIFDKHSLNDKYCYKICNLYKSKENYK